VINVQKLPTTRYQGSKRKITNWIGDCTKDLKFDTFLEGMGGSGVVSFYEKQLGKEVTYNDLLKHNYVIGKALIENNSIILTDEDITFLLQKHENIEYPSFIQDTFKDIYYTEDENAWLDMIITNTKQLDDEYKRAMAYYAVFQSCLVKRPFNLFHRKNLYIRFRKVKRGFGNKTTWDTPFPVHFKKFVIEINSLIFNNRRNNKSLNFDVLEIPGIYDLVYIDPPYFSAHSMSGVDYHWFYHFLEGICYYDVWHDMIDWKSGHRRLKQTHSKWLDEEEIYGAFDEVFEHFKDSILVVSYRSGGIPNEKELVELLEQYKTTVHTKRKSYKYVLSNGNSEELLFIAT
jgi:adenine-specific DNA methylase